MSGASSRTTALLIGYMMMHPGKKLMFMGGEFGQWHEWRDYEDLAWGALQHPHHQQLQAWNRALNRLYRERPELHASEHTWEGFRWLEADNRDESVFAFVRQRSAADGGSPLIVAFNCTPVPRDDYVLGAPQRRPLSQTSQQRRSRNSAARAIAANPWRTPSRKAGAIFPPASASLCRRSRWWCGRGSEADAECDVQV